jgi:hypothetical protein
VSGGFEVDVSALRQAAEGVNDVLGELTEKKVSDIAPDASAFGHHGLGSTVSDFCGRWERGVENLAKDAREISARLTYSVNAYTHVERTIKVNVDGILQNASGPDPAAF